MKRIAYLGPEGTVSHESALYFFGGEEHRLVPYRLILDAIMATVNGETDYSAVPVENTIEGSVKDSMDPLVHEVDVPIQAEWLYPSAQNLIGCRAEFDSSGEPDFTKITKIFSKDVAIGQCREFLQKHVRQAQFEFVSSTSEGVRIVRENPHQGFAAIGTRLSASLNGLDVLQASITDHGNNFTRFILIGHEPPKLRPTQQVKTTMLVTLPEDYPGALHQVLSAFAWRKLNLSKIESRPTKLRLGSYYFYIDVEAPLQSVLLPAAIAEIEAIGCQVRILGSYPYYSYEPANAEV